MTAAFPWSGRGTYLEGFEQAGSSAAVEVRVGRDPRGLRLSRGLGWRRRREEGGVSRLDRLSARAYGRMAAEQKRAVDVLRYGTAAEGLPIVAR